MKARHIILGVTGSIAAYKSADIVRRMQEEGMDISVVMTQESEEFITPLTLSSLSGRPVHRKMFDERETTGKMGHIQLAQEADAVLIAPATANMIVRFGMSILIRSPFSTSPIVPPSAASGETWPIDSPDVPPEKRPSVISAQAAPSPFDLR